MKKLIVVADWVDDGLNNQEVRSAVEGFVKNPEGINISFVTCTPSTIHTSFIISQISNIEERYGRPQETVIFENTDPRLISDKSLELAKGAEFIITRLASGMYVCGPNAGYDFSLFKNKIVWAARYPNMDKGSQFRSRDLYSRICAHLMDEMEEEMELEEINTNLIPQLDGWHIGHIDTHGNIKTTIKHDFLKGKHSISDIFEVKINSITKKVRYVPNLFGGTPGELVMYPGSSGDRDNPYMEISVWRYFTETKPTTGLHEFNFPRPGDRVEFR